jgi:hypothetical protein
LFSLNQVAVDSQGNAYFAGNYPSGLGFNGTWYLTKFDGYGKQLWTALPEFDGFNFEYGVAVDSKGNSYICGYQANGTGGPENSIVLGYTPDGVQRFSTYLGGKGGALGDVPAIGVDASDNLLAGYRRSTGDYATVKYSPTGTLLQSLSYPSSLKIWDLSQFTKSGLLLGTATSSNLSAYTVENGLTQVLGDSKPQTDSVRPTYSLRTNASNYVFVLLNTAVLQNGIWSFSSSSFTVTEYSPDGRRLWQSKTMQGRVTDWQPADNGYVYVERTDGTLQQFDPLGSLVWTKPVPGDNLKADGATGVVAVKLYPTEMTTSKINPSGGVEWTHVVYAQMSFVNGIATIGDSVYVSAFNATTSGNKALMLKYAEGPTVSSVTMNYPTLLQNSYFPIGSYSNDDFFLANIDLSAPESDPAMIMGFKSSNPSALFVQSAMQMFPGETKAGLPEVRTGAVTTPTVVTVTAFLNGVARSAPVTVLPLNLVKVTGPTGPLQGSVLNLTVTLSGPVPAYAAPLVLPVLCTGSFLNPPKTVTVMPGKSQATLNVSLPSTPAAGPPLSKVNAYVFVGQGPNMAYYSFLQ